MKIILLVYAFCVASVLSKSVKKSAEDTSTGVAKPPTKQIKYEKPNHPSKTKLSKSKLKAPPLPILAIEIVDPNENKTKSKNSKRTIGSSLGYGFQPSNSFGVTNKPRLVYYKYTENIPAFPRHSGYSQRGLQPPPVQQYQNRYTQQQYQQDYSPPQKGLDIQKSVEYDLGTREYIEYNKPAQQQQQQQYYQPGTTLFTTFNQQGQIGGLTSQLPQQNPNAPVILLKVYSNQLGNPIYPNLPETHPYAGLNNINLQSLLSRYVHPTQDYQQGGESGQQYQTQHTQVNQQTYQQPQYYQQPQQHQQPQQPQQQYYDNAQPNYQQDQNQDYYLNQANDYHQQYQDDVQQQQYQQYQQQPHHIENVYHQKTQYKAPSLPTEENYPDEDHTRVIFYSNTGHIAKPESIKPEQVSVAPIYKQPQQPQPQPQEQIQQQYSSPQSYSSLQFYQPKQQEDEQEYNIPQPQDSQGYYYYKPEDYQDYQQPEQPKEVYASPAGTITENGELDTQKVQTPHNYHAHPIQKKRHVRRPVTIKKITKVKNDDDDDEN